MKIEAKHNIKTPAYAAGAAVLAAAVLAGCSAEEPIRYAGETETQRDYTVELMGETTVSEDDYTYDREEDKTLLDDISDCFYKELTDDDVMEHDGITFAKNQLLVSCEIGTSYEQVETICNNMGAKIVGYIELTSDFQIEFDEDKTFEELEELAEDFKTYSFVLDATLNHTYEIGTDDETDAGPAVEAE